MKLDLNSSQLVIVGGWNPNIFSIRWIEDNFRDTYFLNDLDPNNPEKDPVIFEVELGQIYSPLYAPIQIHFNGLKMRTLGGRLEFILLEERKFELLEECAKKICDYLPRTTVTSYGVNFTFIENEINQYIADIIKSEKITNICNNFSALLGIENYDINIPLDNRDINISTKVDRINNISSVSFNFSFNIDNLDHFKLSISKYPVYDLYESAKKIMLETYKIELKD